MNTGLYKCVSKVTIRREPRIIENTKGTNQVGMLDVGTQRKVYEIVTQSDNSIWGRISQPDAAGISQWVCIQGLNRTYMELVYPDVAGSKNVVKVQVYFDDGTSVEYYPK